MPTRSSSRWPWWCLALALSLATGWSARADAKPPDLPRPIEHDFVPLTDPEHPPTAPDDGQPQSPDFIPMTILDSEDQEVNGPSMADRCEAMRTVTRCALFALNPLTWNVRLKPHCNFDEEAPYPVVCVGETDLSVRDFVRDATVTLCTGPFSPFYFKARTTPTCPPLPVGVSEDLVQAPLTGGAVLTGPWLSGEEEQAEPPVSPPLVCPSMGPIPVRDVCPHTHTCPFRDDCPTACGTQPWAGQNAVLAWQVQAYLAAGELYANVGLFSVACECYERVQHLCPGSCHAADATDRLRSLHEKMQAGGIDQEAQEEADRNVCPAYKESLKRKVAPVIVPPDSQDKSVLDRLDDLEKAGRLYEEAERLLEEGEFRKARLLYEEIIQLCPGHRYAMMAADRLQHLKGMLLKPAGEEPIETPDLSEHYQAIERVLTDCLDAVIGQVFQIKQPARKAETFLNSAEDLRQIENEWSRFWLTDQPSPAGYDRSHGGEEPNSLSTRKTDLDRNLETPIHLLCKDVPLRDLLNDLHTWKGVRFRADQEALDEAGISLDQKVSLHLSAIPMKKALQCALDQLMLEAIIEGETIVITTRPISRDKLVSAGYDVSELLNTQDGIELVAMIKKRVAPKSWDEHGGPGVIEYNPDLKSLFIQNSVEVQEAVQEFLELQHRKADSETERNGEEEPNRHKCGESLSGVWESRPSIDSSEQISQLLARCREALLAGRIAKAEMFASRALALDPLAVASDPLVYKMQLLNQVNAAPVTLKPALPRVDPSIIRAYNEILEMVPPRLFIEVHEANSIQENPGSNGVVPRLILEEEPCELEIIAGPSEDRPVQKRP